MTISDLSHIIDLAHSVWGIAADDAEVMLDAPRGTLTVRLAESPTWLTVRTSADGGYSVSVSRSEYDRASHAETTIERRTATYASIAAACDAAAKRLRGMRG